jgi:CBS-domain-containing membrane protein
MRLTGSYRPLGYINGISFKIRQEFRALWKNYLYQSSLAVIVILFVLWLLSAEEAVIIASIGSTAFIIFTMPSYPTAKSRRVIGGHLIGFFCGVLGAWVLGLADIPPIIIYSLAVGISIFLMVALNFEHAPAAGTALGIAISGFSLKVLIAILTSVIILALAHHYLKRYLRDLM